VGGWVNVGGLGGSVGVQMCNGCIAMGGPITATISRILNVLFSLYCLCLPFAPVYTCTQKDISAALATSPI